MQLSPNLVIRAIEPQDNIHIALIIRDALTEFGANKPGTVFSDPTTDALYELFRKPRSTYYVALLNGEIIGGAGIYPTEGLPPDTCELVKMYLRPVARGKGLGKLLINKCMAAAIEAGYEKIYLETMPELKQAVTVYEKLGFTHLDGPLGNSGHFACGLWMIKKV